MNVFRSSNSPTPEFSDCTIVLSNHFGNARVSNESRRHPMFNPTIQSLIVPH